MSKKTVEKKIQYYKCLLRQQAILGTTNLSKAALHNKLNNFPRRLQIIFAPWVQNICELQMLPAYPQQTPGKSAAPVPHLNMIQSL